MSIPEHQIEAVKKILTQWNPLGDTAKGYSDLDDYNTEAIDILFHTGSKGNPTPIVREILNEAFYLDLSLDDCSKAGHAIKNIISIK